MFDRYRKYVAAIANRVLGHPQDADDLTQEVFLEAHRFSHTLRSADATKGWLATITMRVAMRALRRRRRATLVGIDEVPEAERAARATGSPECREVLHQLCERLELLPPKQRAAWTLRRVDGCSLREVAEVCGCSLAAVKRRVSAAECKLKRVVDLQG